MTDQVNADWTELQVTIPAADTDRAGDIAQMVVPYGIYIEDYSHLEEEAMEIAHIDLIDEDLLKKDRTKSIIHVYISPEENPAEAISFLKERFEAVGIENTITAANCAEEDWINNWKKYFKPIPVGNRLLVRPMWEDEYEAGDRVVLHLEPGLAVFCPSPVCCSAQAAPLASILMLSPSRLPSQTQRSTTSAISSPASAAIWRIRLPAHSMSLSRISSQTS